MTFRLDESLEILRATPAALRGLVRDVSEPWLATRTDDGSWTARDVLGHLIVLEDTDWLVRARLILEHGPSRPFERVDREARPQATAIGEMLDLFDEARARNLGELAALGLDDDALGARGAHPVLGEVDLRNLLATWTVHDLSHLAQMAETMAKRYREEVGPWRRFLPVLDRPELPSD